MNLLRFSEAKQIPIIDYLSALGFEPAIIRGVDYWYHAPGRADKVPSFKVDAKQNVWYDHGEGEGGTIIDLGVRLHGCTPVEFLGKLSGGNFKNAIPMRPRTLPREKRDNEVVIQTVDELIHTDLLFYLHRRGIDAPLAKLHCREVGFSIKGKSYYAIGFANRSGGWELRNAWFKGSSSPKDVSLISSSGTKKLAVAEGFMDYLSLLKSDDGQIKDVIRHSDFLVLNSLSFLSRSHELIKSYNERNLFLDNDEAARKAKASLATNEISFQDQSPIYKKYKDVNEFLLQDNERQKSIVHKKSKGMSL